MSVSSRKLRWCYLLKWCAQSYFGCRRVLPGTVMDFDGPSLSNQASKVEI